MIRLSYYDQSRGAMPMSVDPGAIVAVGPGPSNPEYLSTVYLSNGVSILVTDSLESIEEKLNAATSKPEDR